MSQFDFTYISLGAGVQSSCLLALSAVTDRVPTADVAIFADTQDEPREVYEHLERLQKWSPIPIEVCTAGRLSECGMKIPAFCDHLGNAGVLNRQCTYDYKIAPIHKRVRQILGYEKRQRVKHRVRAFHGISIEEIYRMKPSRDKWLTIEYPLIDLNLHRQTCRELFVELTGLPEPPRSACVYCPYHSNEEWRRIRDTDPDAWQFACEYDERIRNSTPAGVKWPVYLHRSLVPLRDAPIDDNSGQTELAFNAECEGMCGV